MMTAEEAAERGKDLSFEKVWAMFAETDRKMAETERFLKEQFAQNERKAAEARVENERKVAEAERKAAEARAEADRIIADLGKRVDKVCSNVGGLNRSMGELIETLIAARLWNKFPQYGFTCAARRVTILDKNGSEKTEIDILLLNTDKAMAVEVKRELADPDEVKRHLKRLELIRAYPPQMIRERELFGAMAGGTVNPKVASYAYESGLYVLELTGETVSLVLPPAGFQPGTW
jgi:predicted RecB family endonuclease